MPRSPKTTQKKPTPFPIWLDEEDGATHIRHLIAQQRAFDVFHEQVMNFIMPQQVELNKKWADWWERLRIRHNLLPGTRMQLDGHHRIIELPPEKKPT